jgi:antitoxin PrlF
MHATLTSKGQITLPKEIRDRLQLDAGTTLDFQLLPDNTITARAVKPDARRIRGLLKSPHAQAVSVQAMDEAVGLHLRDKHPRPVQRRKAVGR